MHAGDPGIHEIDEQDAQHDAHLVNGNEPPSDIGRGDLRNIQGDNMEAMPIPMPPDETENDEPVQSMGQHDTERGDGKSEG